MSSLGPSFKQQQTTLTFLDRIPVLGTLANSADQAQMTQNTASDQGPKCLLAGISMQNTVKVQIYARNPYTQKWTHLNDKDGQVHCSK